ncbi:hypothetical protein A4G99_20015 [Haladaptatus sp. R4]|uniref:hypothetical protein n=1 Tax=Haladaptatus sp. R4 TaxID=1679489 RepID=UPI0007B4950A|nr:hypothetical protein [Haladaptatus sp. R4]KZN22487.1 hypothetical protein A4G99_20015 [Haladaptatus sp. R4]
MNARDAVIEVGIAVLSFLVVGVLATELLRERIWPSLLVGIPTGLIAGIVVFGVIHYVRARD